MLTGQGTMFSAGVDLKRASAGGADYLRQFLPALHRLYDAAFNLPKPLIAAVNGHAIAGGAVLAACADRRIMAAGKGRIGTTELQVGVPFPALAFEIVRFAVPPRYLPEFTLGAGTYATDEALTRGWVDEVVEASALMPRALAVAQQYAALSPPAFAQTKKQIRQAVSRALRAKRQGDRREGHRDLVRGCNARLHPRLRRTHAEEGLSRLQPLLEVGDDVLDRFEPDRQPHHVEARHRPAPSARRTIACAWSTRGE